MKYSKTAIGLLTAQYRSVLKKCLLINLGLFALGAVATATPANATDPSSTTTGTELSGSVTVSSSITNAAELKTALETTNGGGTVANGITDISGVTTIANGVELDLNNQTISGATTGNSGFNLGSGKTATFTGGGTISGFNRPTTDPSNTSGSVGAWEIGGTATMTDGNWTVSNNKAGYGALNIVNGSLTAEVDSIVFDSNKSNAQNAALRHDITSTDESVVAASKVSITANKIEFNNNSYDVGDDYTGYVAGNGSAVLNAEGLLELKGGQNIFTSNSMDINVKPSRTYKVGGGAVANQSHSYVVGEDEIGTDSTMVIGTAASTNTFSGNSSSTNGGAVMNRAVDEDGNATMTINGNSTFSGNSATNGLGGALYNVQVGNRKAELSIIGTALFENNTDKTGANDIYNSGTLNLNASESGDSIVLNGGITGNAGGNYGGVGTVNIQGAGFTQVAKKLQNQNVNVDNGATLKLNGADLSGTTIAGEGAVKVVGDSTMEGTNNIAQDLEIEENQELSLNEATIDGNGTLKNLAGGTLNIKDSTINVKVSNAGTLISDPTTYTNTVDNDANAYASFDADTFAATATLNNLGTVDLRNGVTFASGAKITGTGTTNLVNGTTNFATAGTSNTNIINVANGANWSGAINGGTINTQNGVIDAISGSVKNATVALDANLKGAGSIDAFGTGSNGQITSVNIIDSEYGTADSLTLALADGLTLADDAKITGNSYYTKVTQTESGLEFSDKLVNTSGMNTAIQNRFELKGGEEYGDSTKAYSVAAADDKFATQAALETGLNAKVAKDDLGFTLGTGDGQYASVSAFVTGQGYQTAANVNTLISDSIGSTEEGTIGNALSGKVNAVAGKQLSTEDFTTAEKNKLADIAEGAQVNVIESVKLNGNALTITDKAVDITAIEGLEEGSESYLTKVGNNIKANKIAETHLDTGLANKINGKLTGSKIAYSADAEDGNTYYNAKTINDTFATQAALDDYAKVNGDNYTGSGLENKVGTQISGAFTSRTAGAFTPDPSKTVNENIESWSENNADKFANVSTTFGVFNYKLNEVQSDINTALGLKFDKANIIKNTYEEGEPEAPAVSDTTVYSAAKTDALLGTKQNTITAGDGLAFGTGADAAKLSVNLDTVAETETKVVMTAAERTKLGKALTYDANITGTPEAGETPAEEITAETKVYSVAATDAKIAASADTKANVALDNLSDAGQAVIDTRADSRIETLVGKAAVEGDTPVAATGLFAKVDANTANITANRNMFEDKPETTDGKYTVAESIQARIDNGNGTVSADTKVYSTDVTNNLISTAVTNATTEITNGVTEAWTKAYNWSKYILGVEPKDLKETQLQTALNKLGGSVDDGGDGKGNNIEATSFAGALHELDVEKFAKADITTLEGADSGNDKVYSVAATEKAIQNALNNPEQDIVAGSMTTGKLTLAGKELVGVKQAAITDNGAYNVVATTQAVVGTIKNRAAEGTVTISDNAGYAEGTIGAAINANAAATDANTNRFEDDTSEEAAEGAKLTVAESIQNRIKGATKTATADEPEEITAQTKVYSVAATEEAIQNALNNPEQDIVAADITADTLTLPNASSSTAANLTVSGIKTTVAANPEGDTNNYLVTSDGVAGIIGVNADGTLQFVEAEGVQNIAKGDGTKTAPTTVAGAISNLSSALGKIHGLANTNGSVNNAASIFKDGKIASKVEGVTAEYGTNLKPGTSVEDLEVSLDNAIGKIQTGETVVGKAYADQNGKIIDTTYAKLNDDVIFNTVTATTGMTTPKLTLNGKDLTNVKTDAITAAGKANVIASTSAVAATVKTMSEKATYTPDATAVNTAAATTINGAILANDLVSSANKAFLGELTLTDNWANIDSLKNSDDTTPTTVAKAIQNVGNYIDNMGDDFVKTTGAQNVAGVKNFSDGITTAKLSIGGSAEITGVDSAPTSGSNNLLSSGTIYSQLQGKQDTIDATNTLNGAYLTGGTVSLDKLATTDLSQYNNSVSKFVKEDALASYALTDNVYSKVYTDSTFLKIATAQSTYTKISDFNAFKDTVYSKTYTDSTFLKIAVADEKYATASQGAKADTALQPTDIQNTIRAATAAEDDVIVSERAIANALANKLGSDALDDYTVKTADASEFITDVNGKISVKEIAQSKITGLTEDLAKKANAADYKIKTAGSEFAVDVDGNLSVASIAASKISGLATVATSGKATDLTDWETATANFLTEHQSLADYAKTADVVAKASLADTSLDIDAKTLKVMGKDVLTTDSELNGAKLANGSVDTAALANGAVTTEKLSDSLNAEIAKIADKADASKVYNKEYIDGALNAKADKSDLNAYAKVADVYGKDAVDAKLAQKANVADVYGKAAVDSALAQKADKNDVYNKEYINGALDQKANKSEVVANTDIVQTIAATGGADDKVASEAAIVTALAGKQDTIDADHKLNVDYINFSESQTAALNSGIEAEDVAQIGKIGNLAQLPADALTNGTTTPDTLVQAITNLDTALTDKISHAADDIDGKEHTWTKTNTFEKKAIFENGIDVTGNVTVNGDISATKVTATNVAATNTTTSNLTIGDATVSSIDKGATAVAVGAGDATKLATTATVMKSAQNAEFSAATGETLPASLNGAATIHSAIVNTAKAVDENAKAIGTVNFSNAKNIETTTTDLTTAAQQLDAAIGDVNRFGSDEYTGTNAAGAADTVAAIEAIDVAVGDLSGMTADYIDGATDLATAIQNVATNAKAAAGAAKEYTDSQVHGTGAGSEVTVGDNADVTTIGKVDTYGNMTGMKVDTADPAAQSVEIAASGDGSNADITLTSGAISAGVKTSDGKEIGMTVTNNGSSTHTITMGETGGYGMTMDTDAGTTSFGSDAGKTTIGEGTVVADASVTAGTVDENGALEKGVQMTKDGDLTATNSALIGSKDEQGKLTGVELTADGDITASGDATVKGNLSAADGNFTVTTSTEGEGNEATSTTTMALKGDANISGKATFGDATDTTKSVTIDKGTVTANEVDTKSLTADNGTFNETLTVGTVNEDDKLTKGVQMNKDGELTATGLASLDGGINVNDRLTVDARGNLTTAGAGHINGGLTVGDNFKVNTKGKVTAAQYWNNNDTFRVNEGGELRATNFKNNDGSFSVSTHGAITGSEYHNADNSFTVSTTGNVKGNNFTAAGNVTAKDGTVTGKEVVANEGLTLANTRVTSIDTGATPVTGDGDPEALATTATVMASAENAKFTGSAGEDYATANAKTIKDALSNIDNFVGAKANLENNGISDTTDVTTALNSLANNVEAGMGGAFAEDGSWSASMTNDKGANYGDLSDKSLAEAVEAINSNIGNADSLQGYNGVEAGNTVNDNIAAVNATIGDLSGLNTKLKNLTNGTEVSPETVVEALNNIDATLGHIHGLAEYLGSEYKGNLAKGTTVEMHLSALDNAIGDRKQYVNTNGSNGYVASAGVDVATALTEVASNIGTAADLEGALINGVSADNTVNSNIAAINSALGDIDTLKDAAFARGGSVTEVLQNVDGKLVNLDTRMTKVEKDLKETHHELRRGMASMAAMSALVPNPRSSGNTTLSIGTGAYSGHNAVAVGAFHYLTNNLMLNAGVAWGDSRDAVYRVGMSYSF